MPAVTATHGKTRNPSARKRGVCIRIGSGGAVEGEGTTRAFWFTVAEAEALRAELDAAIASAKASQISGLALARPAA